MEKSPFRDCAEVNGDKMPTHGAVAQRRDFFNSADARH
jgi:hypothetical protein